MHRWPSTSPLAAPTLLRSQALALVYESVHRGEIEERTGRKVLDDIRRVRIRGTGKTTGGWRACSPDCDTSYEIPAVRTQRR
jgi:hypothetical protein